MACMKLGSKSDFFYLDGQTWLCSTGLASDIRVEIGEISFHLHKFPLLSRSMLLEKMIREIPVNGKCNWGGKSVIELNNIPGGIKSFLLVAKFCYGVTIDLTLANVVILRCAADYLQMTEDFGEGNLIMQTENFLTELFGSWVDSFKVIEACEACGEVLPQAEELDIVSRGIDSLASKALGDPNLFSWQISNYGEPQSLDDGNISNVIQSEEWWYEDVCLLKFPIYRRLIVAVYAKGMAPKRIAGSLMCYARTHLSFSGRKMSIQIDNRSGPGSEYKTCEADQRTLLEEIVELLPIEKGANSEKFLLRLLRTSMIVQASNTCKERLEKMIGMLLNEAAVEDLLIPNMGHSADTLYDIDCMQRIVKHFILADEDTIDSASNYISDEDEYEENSPSLTPLTMVANLVDNYLAEVAPDVNLKLNKFQSLAAMIPDYARLSDDRLYRAIDIYLKAHAWLTDSEKEQLCRLMNLQKFSLEASSHAAQNERLPLRVIIQVLFFEQLSLRTSVADSFFVAEEIGNSRNLNGSMPLARTSGHIQQQVGSKENMQITTVENVKERIFELENKCSNMKQDIDRLVKTKGVWNNFFRKFGLRLKMNSCDIGGVKIAGPRNKAVTRTNLPTQQNSMKNCRLASDGCSHL